MEAQSTSAPTPDNSGIANGSQPLPPSIELRDPNSIVPHELNSAIYGEDIVEDFKELRTSIEAFGVIEPVLVTQEGILLSGHRRLKAAKELGLPKIPTRILVVSGDLSARKYLLEANRYRVKTNEIIGREFKALKAIEAEEAKLRQKTKAKGRENFSQAEKGKASDRAAAKLGVSGPTAEKAAKVVEKIDALKKSDPELGENLRKLLNGGSVDRAYKSINRPKQKKAETLKGGGGKSAQSQGDLRESHVTKDTGEKLVTLKTALACLEREVALNQDDVSELAQIIRDIAEQCQRICEWPGFRREESN